MKRQICRVCGNDLFLKSLCRFEDMPLGAQSFPDIESVRKDRGVDLDVRQCKICGMVQLTNQPVTYYKDVIRASAFSDEMREFRLEQFRRFLETYGLYGQKILEIGSGRGEYLNLLATFDVQTYGIEHNEASVRECLRKGLQVFPIFLGDKSVQIDEGPFDAFIFLNFLEHIPDPNTLLRTLYSNLADGAIGLIEVPNFDETLDKNLFFDFIVDHLLYFTEDTLTYTLQHNGFEVLKIEKNWHGMLLSAVVKKRVPHDLSSFQDSLSRLGTGIRGFIEKNRHRRIAVWGASHHALTILSMFQLQNDIVYIVDSAPFKQNRFTPVTHIRVIAPKVLKEDPVDAIIVMAAGYSDEVVSIIRAEYLKDVTIAVLRNTYLEEL